VTKLRSKKNPGYRDFKSQYRKKILGTQISNPGTGKKSWVPYRDFKILVLEKILGTGISKSGYWKKTSGYRDFKSQYWKPYI
jgi:hypothetical protein